MAMASTGCVRSYHQPSLQDGKSTFRVPNHLELMKKVGLSLGIFWFMAMIQPGSSHFSPTAECFGVFSHSKGFGADRSSSKTHSPKVPRFQVKVPK